jgi:hypothetical protein
MPSYSGIWSLEAQYQAKGLNNWPFAPTYWIGLYGTSGLQGTGTTTDSSDNVYYSGRSFSENAGALVKFSPTGGAIWQKSYTTCGLGFSTFFVRKVVTDTSGNIYACMGDNTNIYAVKLDSSGTIQWQRGLYDGLNKAAYGVAIDSSTNVFVCGMTNTGAAEVGILAKYNSSGVIQWQRRFDGTNAFYGVATDSSGNVFCTGYGSAYIYVVKYNSSGTLQWQRRLGGSDTNEAYNCKTDSSGNVYFCCRCHRRNSNPGINSSSTAQSCGVHGLGWVWGRTLPADMG